MRWKIPANHEVITMAIPCGGIGDRDGWRLLKDHGLNVTTNGKYRANFGALKEAVNRTHAVMGMEDAGKSVWRNYPKQPGGNQ